MQPRENLEPIAEDEPLEVVVGIFDSHRDASRVAASLRGPELEVKKISRRDPAAPSQMPEIAYEDVDELLPNHVAAGALTGGALGVGSGILLLGVTGLGVAAPVVGLIAGSWIGGIAGLDETKRGIKLPDAEDYQSMLKAGKSFVVIAGDQTTRFEYGAMMKELGAEQIHQHPPLNQVIR